MTTEQFYSELGQKIAELENKKKALLNKQGYYSKGVAKLGSKIEKLKLNLIK